MLVVLTGLTLQSEEIRSTPTPNTCSSLSREVVLEFTVSNSLSYSVHNSYMLLFITSQHILRCWDFSNSSSSRPPSSFCQLGLPFTSNAALLQFLKGSLFFPLRLRHVVSYNMLLLFNAVPLQGPSMAPWDLKALSPKKAHI